MPHPWAVHDAQTSELVGFAMISDNIPPPIDDDLVGPYYLWKLLIDHRLQGRGYGAATLDAVVDYLRTRPGAGVLYTTAQSPGSPRGFYSATASPTPAGSCGTERPRARPRAARLTGGSLAVLKHDAQISEL